MAVGGEPAERETGPVSADAALAADARALARLAESRTPGGEDRALLLRAARWMETLAEVAG